MQHAKDEEEKEKKAIKVRKKYQNFTEEEKKPNKDISVEKKETS